MRDALFGPNSGGRDDGTDERDPVPVRLGELDGRLSRALELMVRSPARWILVIETASELYVQFLADEEGTLVAECVSNQFLDGDVVLSEEAEELLPVLGWQWPAPPNQPNWITVEFHNDAALDTAVLALHTLRRVFGCDDDDPVFARLFRSARTC